MDIAHLSFPGDLHYLVDHDTWARENGDGTVTVGISALGIALSGEIYMCRPRAVGSLIEAQRGIAVVELAKAIVSVRSPLSGEVVAINDALADRPELIHEDPYGEGWIAKLRPARWDEDRRALVTGATVEPAMRQHAWLMQQAAADSPDAANGAA